MKTKDVDLGDRKVTIRRIGAGAAVEYDEIRNVPIPQELARYVSKAVQEGTADTPKMKEVMAGDKTGGDH